MNTISFRRATPAIVLLLALPALAQPAPPSGQTMDDLAKKLANPVASLISVPIQSNLDWGGGPEGDGVQLKINFQPVVPVDVSADWKLVTRYIVPYIYQKDRVNLDHQSGLGDCTATFWLSPAADRPGAPIWGIGPVFQLPTATDPLLGAKKWCVGPSVIVLKQQASLTYGILANQVWSFAGDKDRAAVSYLYVQPFFAHTTPQRTTYTVNSETVYNWEARAWTIPVNFMVTQLVMLGQQPVSFQGGIRGYLDRPPGGPDWGLRFGVTFIFK